MKTHDTAETLPTADDNCVTLDQPIKRGTSEITNVTLRKPASGELRGVLLIDLLNMDVSSLIKVIPRISSPGSNRPSPAPLAIASTISPSIGCNCRIRAAPFQTNPACSCRASAASRLSRRCGWGYAAGNKKAGLAARFFRS